MPRTRHNVDRSEKVTEIVEAAKRRLLEGGLSALSMAGIARELGVAQQSVYWYFPSRDHLFVAVVQGLMSEVAAGKPPTSHDVVERAVWIVDRVADVHPLLVAMRERAQVAEVVAELEREIDAVVRRMVKNALGEHVRQAELDVAVESFLATVEGVLLRQLPPPHRAQVVSYALARFRGQAWP